MYQRAGRDACLRTGQVAVLTTPSLVVAQNPQRLGVAISNLGPATVYLGTSNAVTTSNGFALASGISLALDNPTALYVVAAGTGTTISFLEESQ